MNVQFASRDSFPSEIPVTRPRIPLRPIPSPAHDFTTQFADVSREFSRSLAISTIEAEIEGLMADKRNNDLLEFFGQNLHDYEQGNATPIVKGRLRAHIQFWIDIGAPEWVLSVLKHGYFIPFKTTPPSIRLGNNRSAKNHPGFVSEAVSDLLELGLITEMFSPPTVVNPLTVSFNSEGKGRLILDLRHVNKHVQKARFRMEDWRVFLQYIVPDGVMFKFDISQSGYHHLDIAYRHQQFLGFAWPLDSSIDRFFCFNVFPFGLSSAPYLFLPNYSVHS